MFKDLASGPSRYFLIPMVSQLLFSLVTTAARLDSFHLWKNLMTSNLFLLITCSTTISNVRLSLFFSQHILSILMFPSTKWSPNKHNNICLRSMQFVTDVHYWFDVIIYRMGSEDHRIWNFVFVLLLKCIQYCCIQIYPCDTCALMYI